MGCRGGTRHGRTWETRRRDLGGQPSQGANNLLSQPAAQPGQGGPRHSKPAKRLSSTTEFTRRARVTLVPKPTLPPARVERFVIQHFAFEVESQIADRATKQRLDRGLIVRTLIRLNKS